MKTLTLLFSLFYCSIFAQNNKQLELMCAMREINREGCRLHRDSTLMAEAEKISTYCKDTTTSEYLEQRFYYRTPMQKYIVFALYSKKDYSGLDIPHFLAEEDRYFYELVQYKYNVGVWANEKICIIVFYKNKNVITADVKW